MALELQTAYPVILGTYALFSFYYEGDAGTFFTLFGITCALAAIVDRRSPASRRSRSCGRSRRGSPATASERADRRGLGRGGQLPLADDPHRRVFVPVIIVVIPSRDPVGGRCST